jgi:hypothetical protein
VRSVLDPPWPALRSLALALDGAHLEWRLGGSALLAAIGLTEEIGDLDVTVPADALEDVRRVCEPWLVEVVVGDAPEPWCSDWLVRLRIGDTEVDVIGGLCVRTTAGPVPVPQDLGGHLDIDGVPVPLADPAVWWWVYRAYRPAKADRLAEVVDPARRDAIEQRLGPPQRAGR